MRQGQFIKLFFVFALLAQEQLAKAQRGKTILQQQTDSVISTFRSQQTDTICVFETYCVGCVGSWIKDESPCATKGILIRTHVLGKSGSKTTGFYLDNCNSAQLFAVRDDKFWNYFFSRKQEIKVGEIKPFFVVDKERGGKLERVRRNHGFQYAFVFYVERDTVEQYFDEFALTRKVKFFDKERRNVNYKQNAASPIRHLAVLLGSAVIEAGAKRTTDNK